jgi:8-amino-7-oxononanoate synthase
MTVFGRRMNSDQFQSLLQSDLVHRRDLHLLRERRVFVPVDATHVKFGERTLVNFASNDYLGLTHHRRVIDAMTTAAQSHGTGAGAAGLITGYTDLHAAAEKRIATWKGTEASVLLSSGYQANHAAVQTLAAIAEASGRPIRFLLDKLSHASLLDAVRATFAEYRVFPHNQLSKLQRLLESAPAEQIQVVVTESIFSMDGDAADLAGLAALKAKQPFLLLLDEAHGAGVFGEAGSGYANEAGFAGLADVTIATLSKAAGVVGGAVCASVDFCRALVNHGRAYIYSTAVPAPVASAAISAIEVMRDEPQRQRRVRELARRVREALNIPGVVSPIVPIILGEEQAALAAAARLLDAGMLVIAVRPPTVPRGSSRLRVTLSSEHTDAEVDQLIDVVKSLR